jgi:hypothetical protein
MSPEAEEIPREPSLETILQQMVHVMSMNTEILRQMQVCFSDIHIFLWGWVIGCTAVTEQTGKIITEGYIMPLVSPEPRPGD